MTDDATAGTAGDLEKATADAVPAPQVLTDLLRTVLHPALKAEGLRRSGRTWREGDSDRGWVLLQVQGDRYNTRDQVGFTMNTAVWPRATWEVKEDILGGVGGLPHVGGDAPFFARPSVIVPDWPSDSVWWQLDATTDIDVLGKELVNFAIHEALPWARRHCEPDQAVRALRAEGGSKWHLINAVAVLRRSAPGSVALRDTVEGLTAAFVFDPRPIDLRPHLILWRQEAGLSEVLLPETWSPSRHADMLARFGSVAAARAAGYESDLQS